MKNTLKIYTGPRQSGITTKLLKRVAKIHRGYSVLLFARNKHMVRELMLKQTELKIVGTCAVARTAFPQVQKWLDTHPTHDPRNLIVVVDDVTPGQLQALMDYSSKGVQVFCGYSNDQLVKRETI